MKETVHIIMPMAGEGSRFKEKGYEVPKPLIKLNDKELFRHSLDSLKELEQYYNVRYTFIVRKEFITDYNIDETILTYYPNANILSVDKTTKGALETVMIAEDYIQDTEYVIIIDCDLEFKSSSFIDILISEIEDDNPCLLSFYSKDPKYSYAAVNKSMQVINVAEKERISTHALCGCYCIGDGKLFKKCAKIYIYDFYKGKINSPEIYISLIYNYIINEINNDIYIYDMNFHNDHYWSYGTPNDLEYYNYEHNIWDK